MTSKRLGLVIYTLALASGIAVSVRAQEPPPGAKAATEAMNTLQTLWTPEAKADLGLNPEQIAAISKLREDHFAAAKLRPRPVPVDAGAEKPEKAEPTWQEVADDATTRLADILDADQLKRLEQIMRQMSGYAAFIDPKVQAALELNDAQKEQVAAIREGLQKEVREIMAAKEDRSAANVKFMKSRDKARTDMVSLLTEDQKTRWADLVGKEFKGATFRPAPARPPLPPPAPNIKPPG